MNFLFSGYIFFPNTNIYLISIPVVYSSNLLCSKQFQNLVACSNNISLAYKSSIWTEFFRDNSLLFHLTAVGIAQWLGTKIIRNLIHSNI